MLHHDMHTVEVKGLLSYFYPLGYDITYDVAESMVGLPIRNCNHVTIGKIDSVNWETGEWFGRIVVDGSVKDHILKGCTESIEIRKSKSITIREKENGKEV